MKPSNLLLLLAVCVMPLGAEEPGLLIEAPPVILRGVPFDITLKTSTGESLAVTHHGTPVPFGSIVRDGSEIHIRDVLVTALGRGQLGVTFDGGAVQSSVFVLPGFTSLFPPIIAIVLALITKQVVLSLFSGIWLGAILTFGGGVNVFTGYLRTVDTYLMRALTNTDHMSIVLFTMTLGGMVGIVSRSGGTQGIVTALARYVQGRRTGQLATWLMGILIFFDDYANTLLVGNTMRPFTDKLRISREKLSYLVDSTSAPIASIALASTWIGFELGLLDSSFSAIGLDQSPYITFLEAIPYSFYSVSALLMVVVIAGLGRDFGPMYQAEHRSIVHGKVLRDGATPLMDQELANMLPPEGVKSHWYTAIIPIITMVAVLAIGLYVDGKGTLGGGGHPLREIIGAANSFKALIWASALGAFVAGLLAVFGRTASLHDTVDAFLVGFKAMFMGVAILTLARALQMVTHDLHTADYIFHLSEGILNPRFLPALTFIIAALISFSTGTAWGSMAILVPLVIPLAFALPHDAGMTAMAAQAIFLGSIGAILSGAIFGDHCSPISDTTVMSSMASGADHIDHVRTQLPYGMLVAGVTLVVGYLPVGFGMNPWLSNLLALGIIILVVWKIGRDPAAGTA